MDLSIVVPMYKSAIPIDGFCKEIINVITPMRVRFEIILVDDGSGGSIVSDLTKLNRNDSRIKGICLYKNSGQHTAIAIGLKHSLGEYAFLIDDDMNFAIPSLPIFWDKAIHGFDVVSGNRNNRSDTARVRLLCAGFANPLLGFIAKKRFLDATSPIKLFKKNLVIDIIDKNYFSILFPEFMMLTGNRIIELTLSHSYQEIVKCKSRYTVSKILKHALLFLNTIIIARFGFLGTFYSKNKNPNSGIDEQTYAKIGLFRNHLA